MQIYEIILTPQMFISFCQCCFKHVPLPIFANSSVVGTLMACNLLVKKASIQEAFRY